MTVGTGNQGGKMSLRKKIADSEAVLNWAARRIASYIRMVHRNTRWQRIGYGELDQLAAAGEPVIVVLWHQRLAQSPYFFPLDKGRICSITSAARAGSMVGRVQKLFGMDTIAPGVPLSAGGSIAGIGLPCR